MRTELRTWRLTCDKCKKSVIVQAYLFERPKGWGDRSVGPCGLTNYYRDEDLCPKCAPGR
jgi:hypothetical protein